MNRRAGGRNGSGFESLVLAWMFMALFLGGCTFSTGSRNTPTNAPKGTFKPYTVKGKTYYPLESGAGYREKGKASWYGDAFHGKKTANGETYNMHDMTAAHKILPMGTMLRVTNLDNGRKVEVRVNDRGPFVAGRIIDVSKAAAQKLDIVRTGTANVLVESLEAVPGYDGRDMPGQFYVQIGAFQVQNNARALANSMVQRGFADSRVLSSQVDGKQYWRVQVGAYSRLEAAKQASDHLGREFPGSFVIAD